MKFKELKEKLKNDNIISMSYHMNSFRTSHLGNQMGINNEDPNEEAIVELISDVYIVKKRLVEDFKKWRKIFFKSMMGLGAILLLQIINISTINNEIWSWMMLLGLLSFISVGIKFYNINSKCQYLEDKQEGMAFKRTRERLKEEVDAVIKMNNRADKLNKILEDV